MINKQHVSDPVLSPLLAVKEQSKLTSRPQDTGNKTKTSDDEYCISRALNEYPKMARLHQGTKLGESYTRSVKLAKQLAIACRHKDKFYQHKGKSFRLVQSGELSLVQHNSNVSRLMRRRILSSEAARTLRIKLREEISVRAELREKSKAENSLH